MATYWHNRPYDAADQLDHRDYGSTLARIKSLPEGSMWMLLGSRRGRKTWTLRGLQGKLDHAVFVDLREQSLTEAFTEARLARYFLLDEPKQQLASREDATKFLQECTLLKGGGKNVVLALTPAEYALLLAAATAIKLQHQVTLKSLINIPVHTEREAELQARTEAARAMLPNVPAAWKRSPFLLELLFHAAEDAPHLGMDDLIEAAIVEAEQQETEYMARVYGELDAEQRAVVLKAARGRSIASHEKGTKELLIGAGLLHESKESKELSLRDPIVAWHLTPLRIHHVSDIHVGSKTAQAADIKEASVLATAVDPGTVRKTYLKYLASLAGGGRAPHLLVISGDLVEYASSIEQYRDAKAWVDEARDHLAPHPLLRDGDPRVLLVGGNHDVDWTRTGGEDLQARHRRFAETFPNDPRPRLEVDPAERSLASVRYRDLCEIVLLGSAELGGQVDEMELHRQLRENTEANALSAARTDAGLVHNAELDRLRNHKLYEDIRIAVLHHPVSPLPSIEVSRYAGLLNAGAVKDALLGKEINLVLHGHVHSGWFACETWPNRHDDRKLWIAAAPSLGSREVTEHHGFNVVEILRDRDERGAKRSVVVRRVVRKGTEWTSDEREMTIDPAEVRG